MKSKSKLIAKLSHGTIYICILLLMVIISVGCSSTTANQVVSRVKYISLFMTRNADSLRVYDVRTGEKSYSTEPFVHNVNRFWCREYSFGPRKHPDYPFLLSFSQNSTVTELLRRYEIDRQHLQVLSQSCNQAKSLVAISCRLSDRFYENPNYPEMARMRVVLGFSCLVDEVNDSLIFVDSTHFDPYDDSSYGSLRNAAFDMAGENLYYNKREAAIRFNIATGTLDTLWAGEVPVIPWNSDEVMVYSRQDKKLRLLDHDLKELAFIRTDFTLCYSAFKVDDNLFVIAKREWVQSFWDLHAHNGMEVSLYDFNTGEVVELFHDDPGEILGVE